MTGAPAGGSAPRLRARPMYRGRLGRVHALVQHGGRAAALLEVFAAPARTRIVATDFRFRTLRYRGNALLVDGFAYGSQ